MKSITKMVASMVLSRKIIKPSSCTRASFRRHNLSLFDHLMTHAYIPIASFYPKPANYDLSQVSQFLENSLSKILSSYYPFAGRIIDDKYVDCNDIGAEYLNVRINCPMSEILNHTYNDAIDVVFPQDLPWSNSVKGKILVVQLSHFDCGGIAISVCIKHKIVDGYSVSKFLNDWANTTRQLDFKPSPQFDASSFFPLMDHHDTPTPDIVLESQLCVSKMYHFSSSSLNLLKNIVAMNSEVQNPTRVEVATSLVHKCGATISKEANSGLFKPSLLCHAVNLRPPFSLNTIGNASTLFSLISKTEDEIHMPRFVAQLRKAKQQLRDKWKDNSTNLDQLVLGAHDINKVVGEIFDENKYDIYTFSSLCNSRFYETDFGWGRPIRVSLARPTIKNYIIFLDDPRGDGINALISLTKDDMLRFQSNKELLEFASPVAGSPE